MSSDLTLKEFCKERRISDDKAAQLIAKGLLRAYRLDPTVPRSPYRITPAAARAYDKAVGRIA